MIEALLRAIEPTEAERFALWCARRALRREHREGRSPEPRLERAMKAKEGWLMGQIADRAALARWDETRDVVQSLIPGAAHTAAGAAAWACAYSVSWATGGAFVRPPLVGVYVAYQAARGDRINAAWIAAGRADPAAAWVKAKRAREENSWIAAWDKAHARAEAEQIRRLSRKREAGKGAGR